MLNTKETVTMFTSKIVNRHKARLLKNLEEAGCPIVFRDAVISSLNWMRNDLNEHERTGGNNEQDEARGNY